MLETQCPSCVHRYEVADKEVGQHTHCPKCNHRFLIMEAPRPMPFRSRDTLRPGFRLVFYLGILAFIATLGAIVVYLIGPYFKAGY